MRSLIVSAFSAVVLAAGVWWLWARVAERVSRRQQWLLAFVLVLRVWSGTGLLLVSLLLPGRLLPFRIGDGLWMFALDANLYIPAAQRAAESGVLGPFSLFECAGQRLVLRVLPRTRDMVARQRGQRRYRSQLTRFPGSRGHPRHLVGVVSAVFSARAGSCGGVGPLRSAVLWSSQPLKDTLLSAALIFWCYAFYRVTRDVGRSDGAKVAELVGGVVGGDVCRDGSPLVRCPLHSCRLPCMVVGSYGAQRSRGAASHCDSFRGARVRNQPGDSYGRQMGHTPDGAVCSRPVRQSNAERDHESRKNSSTDSRGLSQERRQHSNLRPRRPGSGRGANAGHGPGRSRHPCAGAAEPGRGRRSFDTPEGRRETPGPLRCRGWERILVACGPRLVVVSPFRRCVRLRRIHGGVVRSGRPRAYLWRRPFRPGACRDDGVSRHELRNAHADERDDFNDHRRAPRRREISREARCRHSGRVVTF